MEEDLVIALDRRAKEIADAAYIDVIWTIEYKAAREIERLLREIERLVVTVMGKV